MLNLQQVIYNFVILIFSTNLQQGWIDEKIKWCLLSWGGMFFSGLCVYSFPTWPHLELIFEKFCDLHWYCWNCSETLQMVHSITVGSRLPAFELCFTSWPKGILVWIKLYGLWFLSFIWNVLSLILLTLLTVFQHLSYQRSGCSPWWVHITSLIMLEIDF